MSQPPETEGDHAGQPAPPAARNPTGPETRSLPRGHAAPNVGAAYARLAPFYDLWAGFTETEALAALLALAGPRDGERTVDVGTGTGRLLGELARRNPSGTNVGVDLSPAMLREARRRLDRSAPAGACFLVEANACALPFAAARFDLACSSFMLDLLPEEDLAVALGELLRILRPGGRLALASFARGPRWYHGLWSWIAKHLPAVLTGCRPVDPVPHLRRLGAEILAQRPVSQHTFPSCVVVARRPA